MNIGKGKRIDPSVGLRVRELRQLHGLTFKQIADRLLIAQSTACDYANRLTLPEIYSSLSEENDRDRLLLFIQSRISVKLLKEINDSFLQRS
jgi:hypothetical protein